MSDKYRGFMYPLMALMGLYWFANSFFLAKQSLSNLSGCDDAIPLLRESLGLTDQDIALIRNLHLLSNGRGCWIDRRVDSVVILVVDALRFDFARHHLPKSVGARLSSSSSQLLHFVADPPTVTMQRLKGMTTGGLPTFADISGNFGGASIEEDTWVNQLSRLSASTRGLLRRKRLAFVGDDTWIDLFPTQFDDAHPFPSFNTRDLDSVDNGCLAHLPRLLGDLQKKEVELIVAHFLGVDHVGHTYGPHNQYMDKKLKQMDTILDTTLEILDESIDQCSVAFVFGDHGMTEDGNHGGGTDEETNAGLFVHFSPACGDMSGALSITGSELGSHSENAFRSISQIDLVPTISLLMGLPIPYANLGGIVPSLFPPGTGVNSSAPSLATALALNAAQVWHYFTVYSNTANRLPHLSELQTILDDAVVKFKEALANPEGQDSFAYREACAKFKLFLLEATELGKRVWTRFDTTGMLGGVTVLFLVLLVSAPIDLMVVAVRREHVLEAAFASLFVLFHCILLTFSNSYIEGEMHALMFFLSVLAISISVRIHASSGVKGTSSWIYPLVIPFCSRIGELFISGHGSDPSIRHHLAHHSVVFLGALGMLVVLRIWLFRQRRFRSVVHFVLDILTLIFVAASWWEKRSADANRNGYLAIRVAISLLTIGIPISAVEAVLPKSPRSATFQFTFKIVMAIMVVTGPSTSASMVLFLLQSFGIFQMARMQGVTFSASPILACFWRFLIRHTFFVTNHACAFSRLQYSAAFVATAEFQYVNGGLSLVLNTFGWEILGFVWIRAASRIMQRPHLLRFYCFFQLVETSFSCVSVSLLRRHLMVWATFAPRFLFSAIFLGLNSMASLVVFCVEALQ
jgi:GPI ethanolamine phosphate transferase 3 subunit O